MNFEEIPTTESEIEAFLVKINLPEKYSNYVEYMKERVGHHGLGHVLFMLKLLKEVPHDLVGNLKYLVIAILFHDVVYSPGSRSNEHESAKYLHNVSLTWYDREDYENMNQYVTILITESPHPRISNPGSDIGKDISLLHDLDYAVLGADWQTYLEYMMGIWAEYAPKFGMEKYVKGRFDFLGGILVSSKPTFWTGWFFNKFHATSFDNMQKEVAILRDKIVIAG